jgi:hypothetical protein
MIPMTYEPMEGVSVDVQDHTQWTSTHGEMISSDLHGDESPSDGWQDPSRGQRQIRGFSPKKRRTFHQRQLSRPVPRGVVPFPLGCWAWKAHDFTEDIL